MKFLLNLIKVRKITDEVRRLVTLVYVNTKLTEEGVRKFYANVLSKTPGVKTLQYDALRDSGKKLKHTSIIDTVTKRVRSFLVTRTKFNDFSDVDNDDTPVQAKIKMNEYAKFNIAMYAMKKNIVQVER